jgi:hypothetical protein
MRASSLKRPKKLPHPQFNDAKPRKPEHFNELSMMHQQKLLSIVENQASKNPDE